MGKLTSFIILFYLWSFCSLSQDNHIANLGYFAYWPLCIYSTFGALAVSGRGFVFAFTMILTIAAYVVRYVYNFYSTATKRRVSCEEN